MVRIKISMPKNCRVCPLFNANPFAFEYECGANGVIYAQTGAKANQMFWQDITEVPLKRHPQCPLLPMPKKKKEASKNANR